jgi:hypothetical protein
MNGPARPGDLYRFDQTYNGQVTHFTMDAQDEDAARYEAEYILNMDIIKLVGATGKLWRVDGPEDVFVADVGPLEWADS